MKLICRINCSVNHTSNTMAGAFELTSGIPAGFEWPREVVKTSDPGGVLMKRTILLLIVTVISSVPMLTAQERTRDPEKLGKVHFPVSCTPAAQQQFDRAVAMLHCGESPTNCFGRSKIIGRNRWRFNEARLPPG
jgi:hypothetical protein